MTIRCAEKGETMTTLLHPLFKTGLAAAALCAALAPARAAGTVDVSWVEPERFADAGRGVIERERTLRALGEYLATLGQRLPDGQQLRLEVLDLDLAGELEFMGTQELRVMRGRADGPHMSLRYALRAEGKKLKAGQAELSDLGYLIRPREGDLGYEKHMIDDWFKASLTLP
jgi:hypothetical protein